MPGVHNRNAHRPPRGYRLGVRGYLQRVIGIVGKQLTISDISLYAYTHVADEGGSDLSVYPAIWAWLSRIQHPPPPCLDVCGVKAENSDQALMVNREKPNRLANGVASFHGRVVDCGQPFESRT